MFVVEFFLSAFTGAPAYGILLLRTHKGVVLMYLISTIAVLAASPDLVIGGDGGGAAAVADAAPAAGGGFFGFGGANTLTVVLMYVAIIGVAWLLLIRPQKKREKAMREMQASIQVGDDVVTSGGMFGNVAALDGDRCIVEFANNKNMRIPMRRTDVFKVEQKPKEA